MSQKIYNSHSFLFPILRYDSGKVFPEYEIRFTFWGNSPIYETFSIGERVTSTRWCPKEILPHRSRVHQDMPALKCGRIPLDGLPFKKCHVPRIEDDPEQIIDNIAWSYGIDGYEAVITGLNIQDVIIGELFGIPYRQFKFNAKGYAQWRPCGITIAEDLFENPNAPPQIISYSVEANILDNNNILFSASIHAINPAENQLHGDEAPLYSEDTLLVDFSLGSSLSIPCVPIPLVCKSYNLWKDEGQFGNPMWNVIYHCSGIYTASMTDNLPDDVINAVSYGLNGTVARSVSGSAAGVNTAASLTGRKKITAYSMTQEPVYPMGSAYSGGIVISDIPSRQNRTFWKPADIWGKKDFEQADFTFYKHDIEVLL